MPDCGVTSTLTDFTPTCDAAELAHYTGETRFFLPGQGGVLTAYLPAALAEVVYGGQSGNYLQVVLEYDDGGSEQVSDTRGSTLTIGALSDTTAEVRVDLRFDGGDVKGPVTVPVTDAQ